LRDFSGRGKAVNGGEHTQNIKGGKEEEDREATKGGKQQSGVIGNRGED